MINQIYDDRQPSLWEWAEQRRLACTLSYAETHLQRRFNMPAHRAKLIAELAGYKSSI